jgi:hypothetical protein
MHVSSDQTQSPSGPLGEILRLQTEFQARLAKETLGYLRRLQGAFSPSAPGTVWSPDGDAALRATGRPGGTVELRLEVENRQRVHCVVTPLVSPLVDETGVTWFPAAETTPPSALLPAGKSTALVMRLSIPLELAPGNYRGGLVLQGIRPRGIAVTVSVEVNGSVEAATRERPTARRTTARRSPARRRPAK